MDSRLKNLNRYVQRMADVKINYHPQRRKAVLIFNDVRHDIYKDPIKEEEGRVNKNVILRKNPDMMYVQSLFFDELLEDTDKIPWTVELTVTNLYRFPKNDDSILIYENGKEYIYSITSVKPINRDVPVVLLLLIYPERKDV